MPLDTTTIDLNQEYQRLTDEMEAHAEEQAQYERGSDGARVAAAQGQRVERLRAGVAWALGYPNAAESDGAGWKTDTVTLGSLTNGDRHLVDDVSDEPGYKRADAYVAIGTVDAPYLEHDADETLVDEFKSTVRNIPDLHPSFVDWAEDRITELSRVGETGNSYLELVQAKRTSATSADESG